MTPEIILCIADKYKHLLPLHIYSLERYWPSHPTVNVLGFTKPDYNLPDKFNFISFGEDSGPKDFVRSLKSFLLTYKNDYFIHMFDDCIIYDKVDTKVVTDMFELLKEKKPAKLILHNTGDDRFKQNSFKYKEYDISDIGFNGKEPKGCERVFVQPFAIWRTDFFNKYLTPVSTMWEFEKQSNNPIKDTEICLILRNPAAFIKYVILYIGGHLIDWDNTNPSSMSKRSRFGGEIEPEFKHLIEDSLK